MRYSLRSAVDDKRRESKAYLGGSVHFPQSSWRETADPASQAALVDGVEMAKMNHRWPRQA
jgi:hypothetical protein